MDTIAAYFAYLFFQLLDLIGLNLMAIKLAGDVLTYHECLTRSSLYSQDLTIQDACYKLIPVGYVVIFIVAVFSYFVYRKLKKAAG